MVGENGTGGEKSFNYSVKSKQRTMRKPYSYIYPGNLDSLIFPKMNAHNTTSTDLDRSESNWSDYPKDDPQERKALLVIMVGCLVAGIVGPMLILLYAEEIDNFMNSLYGAITLVCIFGAVGIYWFIWRIRKMF